MIDKRPEYINLRSRASHWEADMVISRKSKAAVMVLAERRARYVIFKKLDAKTAFYMHKATVESLTKYQLRIRQSITYDNGTENALHELTNKKLGIKSFFVTRITAGKRGPLRTLLAFSGGFILRKLTGKIFPNGT